MIKFYKAKLQSRLGVDDNICYQIFFLNHISYIS